MNTAALSPLPTELPAWQALSASAVAPLPHLREVLRDPNLGPRVVPILVDEARTFGMKGLLRQIGIYAPESQKYTPVDKDQVMYYREDKAGQILQEGINEAGAMSSSMFGPQRTGDLAWAAGDMQARGFLLGDTSGRTTLNGEGLQHEDGHSQLVAGGEAEIIAGMYRLQEADASLRGLDQAALR